jgi:hypothetical protein
MLVRQEQMLKLLFVTFISQEQIYVQNQQTGMDEELKLL